MIYLGLHNGLEAGAALIVNGKLIGAVHEERFVRIKGYRGWPENSIKYLLDEANINIKQVDKIVYGMFDGVIPDEIILPKLIQRVIQGVNETPSLSIKYQERIDSEIKFNKNKLYELMENLRKLGVDDRVCFIDHHLSHAATAYYCSPFDDCFVFTCDGKGSFQSYSAWYSSNGLKRLDFGTTFDSAGYYYGNITRALGFKSERHEGKVTGLAAKGDPTKFRHITDKMLQLRDNRICGCLGDYYMPWFMSADNLPMLFKEVAKYSREDVAAATQKTLEYVMCGWIKNILQKYAKSKKVNVALAGGVFANVKLNQRVRELEKVNNVYIHPAMGDGGIPLGGILAQMYKDGDIYKKYLSNVYLGCAFSDEEIYNYLKKHNIKFNVVKDIPSTLVRLFKAGKPVGFFRGRMEYGPRALCNRSILYHARDVTVNEWLNKKLNRSDFMPFAPVTTAELAPRCFIGWKVDDYAGDFMTMTYDCTDEFKKNCPAVVHVDGTARPQIVRKKLDPEMHSIITKYHELTGDLSFINTSFNNHEEPIVCNIKDAINSYKIGNIDALIIGKYIIELFPNEF